MKKYQYIFAALLAIAACQKNEVAPETIDEEPVWGYITAEISTTAVKGVLVDGEDANTLDFKWEVGDKIRMAVNKGTLETPNYAYRNGYIYSVNDGEHTVTIKYDKGTGENIANYIVGAWYPWLDKENSEPTAIRTTQDYSTGKVSIPLHATNVSTENPIDVGTSAGADVELSQKLVFGPYNPGGTAFSVLGFRLTKGGAERTIKSIKVNNGSQDYTLTNINTALTDDVKYFYIVLPASDTPLSNFKATIIANDGVNDLEYTRTKSSYTPTAGKVTRFPQISDLDETGKHIWIFGNNAATASSVDTPLFYWWETAGDWNNTSADTHTASYADHVTYTMVETSSPYRSNLTLIAAKRYGASYTSTSMDRNKSFPVYPGVTANGSGQIPFLAVHSGNYPVFAIKMTNPAKIGTSRTFTTRLDSRTSIDDLPAEKWVDKIGNNDTSHKFLSSGTNESDEDVDVVYYDLSSSVVGSNGVIANTRVIPFCSWQVRILNVVDDAAPTYDVYWAGFFNSVAELTTFASSH